jgi:threonine aldolase
MGMIAAFCGCQTRVVVGERGVMTWDQIKRAISPKIYYRAQTGLICLENSHNMAGGTVTPLAVMEEIWAGGEEAGLPVHLDGARVFNAAVAAGVDVATFTRGFATVSCCLSKGLGAPVGSVLVGSAEHIRKARVFRKALGGGMRQAGVLAAAGLLALEQGPGLLAADHANARLLAEAIAECEGVEVDLESVQTNIVIFTLSGEGDAPALVARLKEAGVLGSAIGPHAVRLVTHSQVSRAECEQVAETLVRLLQKVAA